MTRPVYLHGILQTVKQFLYTLGMEGKTLRIIREHLGLTQEEMGAKIGVAGNTIARWERDELKIHPTAAKLAITFLDNEGVQKIIAS